MPVSMLGSPRRLNGTPRGGFAPAPAPVASSTHANTPATPFAPPAVAEVFTVCENCGISILSSNKMLHEAHCVRHYKKCPHCGEKVEIDAFEAHMQQQTGSLEELIAALDKGDAPRVRSALDHGGRAILEWRDAQNASLLHLVAAAARDRWDMHALITECTRLGADVHATDQFGWTPLHAAAKGGSAGAASILIGAGADVQARNALGTTPLEVCNGQDVRAALLAAGAELPGSNGSSRASSRGASRGGPRIDAGSGTGGTGGTGLPSARADPHGLVDAFAQRASVSEAARSSGSSRAMHANPNAPSLTPEPPSSGRPSSSRHAQRLRQMVRAEPP